MNSQNQSSFVAEMNDVLRKTSKIDKAKDRRSRNVVCTANALRTAALGYSALTGKSVRLGMKNRELNSFGRGAAITGFVLSLAATAAAVYETVSLDGVPELDRLK